MDGCCGHPECPDPIRPRYNERHYEDVARVLYGGLDWAQEKNVSSECLEVLIENFADLFTEDSPHTCCGYPIDTLYTFCHLSGEQHKFKAGFDRKRFLKACGLENEPEERFVCDICKQLLYKCEHGYSEYVAAKMAGELD